MQQITQQQILAWAPNSAAASNGQKISLKGGFVRLEHSADDTFYLGECTGSGKSNYITTADFIEEENPVFRCSCPSRQFPCKHSLALLYEIMAKKSFAVCEIPEDILKKREKKQARDAKAQEKETKAKEAGEAEEVGNADGAAPKKASKAGQAAKAKKIKKQLEGLELTARLVQDLMKAGLGTMGGTALNTYRQLSKQLGDFYLPGPQRILNKLILEMEGFQKDGKEDHYDAAIAELERLNTLVKKSVQYLNDKLEKDEITQDDNLLYEELGGIWKLSELSAIGLSRQNAELAQLAFWVTYDESRKEFIDTGCWVDLETGEISLTQNYRPIKALKYVKQEDSVFGVARASEAVWYPGGGNRRVRWDGAVIRPMEEADYGRVRDFAAVSLNTEAKAVKNYLKDALADAYYIRLLRFDKIGHTEDGYVLHTESGETILLQDSPDLEQTVVKLSLLPDAQLLENQVLLGAFFYDMQKKRLCVQPLSIVTEKQIVRLLY